MSDLSLPSASRAPAPVDLDALNPTGRMWIVDPDELMADLGRRVKADYRGAITTAAGVRAVRESWEKPSVWQRLTARWSR